MVSTYECALAFEAMSSIYASHVSSVLSSRTFAYSNVSSPRQALDAPRPGAVVVVGLVLAESRVDGVSFACSDVSAGRVDAWFACS